TAEEALPLVVALRTLAEMPGVTDRDAVERALAKVESAASGSVEAQTVAVELDRVSQLLPVLQQAIDNGRALALRYYTATRDETTERTVDPMRIFEMDGRSYLEAWCRRAEGMRVFRVDRIDQADILDEAANPPPEAELRDLSEGVFTPAPEHMLVVLRLDPAYAWVADYYPPETETVDPDGRRQVSVRVADPAWVRALALGSAGHVELLSPEWLAESIRDDARTALAAYTS
ncbi:MAG TPA: WYL domain-containing protein, partial [Jatrophihabitantaceae bacterium]|nr:WYL domain-containing protein [Jatrophihabitantaceae bacterium]